MLKFTAGISGAAVVGLMLSSTPASAQLLNPPPLWTFNFGQAQPIDGNAAVPDGMLNTPVRTPLGSTVGYLVRIEKQDGDIPVGIVTLNVTNRTVAIPIERLRYNPARREVLTDMSWQEVNVIPSGIREKGSPYYRFGRPVG
jgi:hypothetical protein